MGKKTETGTTNRHQIEYKVTLPEEDVREIV